MSEGPKRIQLRREAGWRKPEGCIVVARPSRWGNPYVVGSGDVGFCGESLGPGAGFYNPSDVRGVDVPLGRGLTAAEAVQLYCEDLEANLGDDDSFFDELREALRGLRGHDLGCWCRLSDPCHADCLIELANRKTRQRRR